ncbi:MAG: hypothetical protein JHD02_03980 [Thermoleophilaceae bacterium]|nr:hypothetical protein [Thermoleophilaceae bacterium]
MKKFTPHTALAALLAIGSLAISGCGASVDQELVDSAGAHGNALEAVYVIYNQDVLKSASSRDLKDVNAALKAEDPKKATEGDLRRAQEEIDSRIDKLDAYKKKLSAANKKLRSTPAPDFAGSLDQSADSAKFAADYKKSTQITENMGTAAVGALSYATSAFEKYLDFLEAWEGYLDSGETATFVSTANASDKAYSRLQRQIKIVDAKGSLTKRLDPLVGSMADVASEDAQINSLISDLREQFPKSFLPVHIVEKN